MYNILSLIRNVSTQVKAKCEDGNKTCLVCNTGSGSVGWNSQSAFAGVQDGEISSAEVCTGASAAPDSQSLEEDEVMTDDLISVSERDPCLGLGKAEQKKLACRPHQLVIDAPAQTSAANDEIPARTFCPDWAFFFSIMDELKRPGFLFSTLCI